MRRKPDYKDFGISENMYQRKYILKKGEPISTFGINLISFILFLILTLVFLKNYRWTPETSFYEYIELFWEQWSNPLGILILVFVYLFSLMVVYFTLLKYELTWDPVHFRLYEEKLKEWERITREEKEEEEKEKKNG